jgi:hypothetical protein
MGKLFAKHISSRALENFYKFFLLQIPLLFQVVYMPNLVDYNEGGVGAL